MRLKMKKLLLSLILSSLSLSALAVDQHTFIYRVEISEWVAPHSTKVINPVPLPQDMDPTHVWTGAGLCLLPGNPLDLSYNPFTEQLMLQGWVNNVDDQVNMPHQYYFNSLVSSQGDRCVYQSFTPENNVHMHHSIIGNLECKNFGDTPAFCRARLWIHYKK